MNSSGSPVLRECVCTCLWELPMAYIRRRGLEAWRHRVQVWMYKHPLSLSLCLASVFGVCFALFCVFSLLFLFCAVFLCLKKYLFHIWFFHVSSLCQLIFPLFNFSPSFLLIFFKISSVAYFVFFLIFSVIFDIFFVYFFYFPFLYFYTCLYIHILLSSYLCAFHVYQLISRHNIII